jgi:hypothetical protein
MAAGQRATPNAGAARVSGALFAVAGGLTVAVGAASILLGNPAAAHGLAPIAGPGDLVGRFAQLMPVASVGVAGVVAVVVAVLLMRRRLDPFAAALELLILGSAVDGVIAGVQSRVGYATDGSVMMATVAVLMGGSALIAGGIIALLGHRASTNQ